MIQIIHHRHKCIGCDACVTEAPSHWTMDDEDGKSLLLGAQQKKEYFILDTSEEFYWDNQRAAESCPVNIITVKRVKN